MTEAEKAYELLGGYTSVLVPLIILGIAFIGLVVMQALFTFKIDNILAWVAPIFLGIGGGFGSLATMSYYMSYADGLENSMQNLINAGYSDAATQLEAMCPNFEGYSAIFIFFTVVYFLSIFVSFIMAVIKAVQKRNRF